MYKIIGGVANVNSLSNVLGIRINNISTTTYICLVKADNAQTSLSYSSFQLTLQKNTYPTAFEILLKGNFIDTSGSAKLITMTSKIMSYITQYVNTDDYVADSGYVSGITSLSSIQVFSNSACVGKLQLLGKNFN